MRQGRYFSIGVMVFLVTFSLFCGHQGTAAQDIKETTSFASASLDNYVNKVLTEKNIGNFGFKSLADARKSELGNAYPVISIGLQEIKNYRKGEGVASMEANTETTWFPVLASGEAVAKLEIIEKSGQMLAGDFGAASEAGRIYGVMKELPKMAAAEGAEISEAIRILRIPYLKADFIFIEGRQGAYLIPAMPLPGRFGLKNGRLYPDVDVLEIMSTYAQQVEEGMIR